MVALLHAVHGDVPVAKVAAFLDSDARTIPETASLVSIAEVFATTAHRALPVLSNERVVGIVSRRDVIQAVLDMVSDLPDTQARTLYFSAVREPDYRPTL